MTNEISIKYPKCIVEYYTVVRDKTIKNCLAKFRATLEMHPSLKRGTVVDCYALEWGDINESIEFIKALEQSQIGKGKNISKCRVIKQL